MSDNTEQGINFLKQHLSLLPRASFSYITRSYSPVHSLWADHRHDGQKWGRKIQPLQCYVYLAARADKCSAGMHPQGTTLFFLSCITDFAYRGFSGYRRIPGIRPGVCAPIPALAEQTGPDCLGSESGRSRLEWWYSVLQATIVARCRSGPVSLRP